MDGTDKEDKDYCLLQVLPDGGKLLGLFNMGSSVKSGMGSSASGSEAYTITNPKHRFSCNEAQSI